MKEFTIGPNDAGQRLDRFLAKAVPLLPASLAQKYIRIKRIKCNGKRIERDTRLKEGDVLYLKQKNKKGPKGTFSHILREGESMHSVSQKYGIRLKKLYKLNRMSEDSPAPKVGEVLKVR